MVRGKGIHSYVTESNRQPLERSRVGTRRSVTSCLLRSVQEEEQGEEVLAELLHYHDTSTADNRFVLQSAVESRQKTSKGLLCSIIWLKSKLLPLDGPQPGHLQLYC